MTILVDFLKTRTFLSPVGTHLAEVVVADEATKPVPVTPYRAHHRAILGVATAVRQIPVCSGFSQDLNL